jgi:SWI/SNF-related matrix-associated actin-dependent regulator of chromatin subfamily A3
MTSSALVIDLLDSDEEETRQDDLDLNLDDHLVGSGEYQIVGIRYYSGVAHPGEYVVLVREPSNPYDCNAIRVDNLRGEKVGHVKATMAMHLAGVMDGRGDVRVEGTIPRRGNAFT